MNDKSATHNQKKPGRPFGVTLAIFISVLLFCVVPLLQVAGVLIVESYFRNLDNTLILPDGQVTQGVSGGDFRGGITDAQLVMQTGVALAFLVVAIFAWIGKPAFMRFVLVGGVLLMMVISLGLSLIPALFASPEPGSGVSGGSLDGLIDVLLGTQFIATLLVPLYVVWYLNRGPARAFYRGYYLQHEQEGTLNASNEAS